MPTHSFIRRTVHVLTLRPVLVYVHRYDTARQLKEKQDEFCEKALTGRWDKLGDDEVFPDDLQWEALVDVLRGKTKVCFPSLRVRSDSPDTGSRQVHTHCYEAVDFDDLVRVSLAFILLFMIIQCCRPLLSFLALPH